MFTMVILPSVSVPVLSLQITEADPRVSTAASFRTSTFFFTISLHPSDKEIVTHSGMPSGIAATARVTAMRIMYSQAPLLGFVGSLLSIAVPITNTPIQTTMANTPMRRPRLSSLFCKGVAFADVSGKQKQVFLLLPPAFESFSTSSCAIRPMRVLMPVSTTMPLPLPFVTLQPEKTMLSGVSFSVSPFFGSLNLDVLATSSGSPVSAISLTFKSSAVIKRMSAGTTSPVPNITTSPRTMVVVSTFNSEPSRRT
mmetsp:Transcript_66174/g.120622  ORF Transcript_66174/g.120622 Transcript_66174/m.120622 type:complete len:254 (+) Transcript_66174:801-1562(+)